MSYPRIQAAPRLGCGNAWYSHVHRRRIECTALGQEASKDFCDGQVMLRIDQVRDTLAQDL